jgi:competence protein ComEC
MKNRKIIYGAVFLLTLTALVLSFAFIFSEKKDLRIIFLNVGQGDAALIMQGNKQILIDGGPDGRILLEKIGKYIPFWDRKIELMIATHPDQDHIQGLVDALDKYQISSVMQTPVESDSEIYKKYKDFLSKEKADLIEALPGTEIILSDEIEMEILGPLEIKNDKKDTNGNSIIAKLIFKNNEFLFTGDATFEEENDLLKTNLDLSSDVLKISHHGSKYATSDDFLKKINPKEAIISVGKNNYGHPAEEILEKLKNNQIAILRTDEKGDIEYVCKTEEGACAVAN